MRIHAKNENTRRDVFFHISFSQAPCNGDLHNPPEGVSIQIILRNSDLCPLQKSLAEVPLIVTSRNWAGVACTSPLGPFLHRVLFLLCEYFPGEHGSFMGRLFFEDDSSLRSVLVPQVRVSRRMVRGVANRCTMKEDLVSLTEVFGSFQVSLREESASAWGLEVFRAGEHSLKACGWGLLLRFYGRRNMKSPFVYLGVAHSWGREG